MSLPGFKPPKFRGAGKRRAEIPFRGQVAAGGYTNLASAIIPYKYRIVEVKMIFSGEAYNNIEHRWYFSRNINLPTASYPSDSNIFGRESPSASFRGQGLIRVAKVNIEAPDQGYCIKLGTYNAGNYAYNFECTATIEEV